MVFSAGVDGRKRFLLLARDLDLGAIGLITGGAVVAASWALAGASGLPATLHDLVELHRAYPVLLLVDLLPVLSTGACLAYARQLGREGPGVPTPAAPEAEACPREVSLVPPLVQGLICLDQGGCILEMNPTAETIFGWSVEEVRGDTIELLLPAGLDGVASAACVRACRGQVVGRRWETEGRHADGAELALVVSMPTHRTGGRTWISIEAPATADETNATETEDDPDVLPDARFLDGLVREIRPPANVAVAYAALAAEQAAAQGLSGCAGDLERIRNVTRRLRIVADDLAELARISGGEELEILLQDVDLRQAVEEAAQDAVRLEAQVRGVEPRPATVHGGRLFVRADGEKLRCVILHLVMSLCPVARPGTLRIDLTPRGGTTTVDITGEVDAEDVLVETPGLQLCRRLVAAMGGRLDHDAGAWMLELPSPQGPAITFDEERTCPLDMDWDDVLRAHRMGDGAPEAGRELETPLMQPRYIESLSPRDADDERSHVLYVDPDARGRERFTEELTARGVWVGAAAEPGPARSLATLPDTRLLVIRSGGAGMWSHLRFLQSDPVLASLPPALVDLEGGAGHVLRIDSMMQRTQATERLSLMCMAIGVGITGPRAFVLAAAPTVRQAMGAGLRRAGWRCTVSTSAEQLLERLESISSLHLVIVDGAHPDCGAALAALYRAGKRVSHVSLLLPGGGASPELTVPSEARVPADQVYDDLVCLARRRRVDLLPSLEWA